MKKTKLLIFGFFILIIISLGVSVKADSNNLTPNQYKGYSNYLAFGDNLHITFSSDKPVNFYVMTNDQINIFISSPGDTANSYYKSYIGLLSYTGYVIKAPEDGTYWILLINPSDTQTVYYIISYSIDYYYPPDPEYIYITTHTTRYDFSGYLVAIAFIIATIVLAIKLSSSKKQLKRSQPIYNTISIKEPIAEPLTNKGICPNCKSTNPIGTSYCTNCGHQI